MEDIILKLKKKMKIHILKIIKIIILRSPSILLKGIGISQIISIPNDFYELWNNNFIVASLNAGSLFRFKFDEQFSKAIYYERIFINQRIRDLKFSKKLNRKNYGINWKLQSLKYSFNK